MDGLGVEWLVIESGYYGHWIRRGATNTFDAEWDLGSLRVRAELEIEIADGNVTVYRKKGTDGMECRYTGSLDDSGNKIYGTFDCPGHLSDKSWEATIR